MEKAEFSAYITNLGKYNEGDLVGEWVEFPIDEDDFADVLDRIGINEEYEEWFVTDYDCNLEGFDWEELGEYPSYEKLQEFGELVDSIDDFEAVNNAYEVTGDLEQAINGLQDGRIIYYSGISSLEDMAYQLIDDMGGPEELGRDTLETYFDYEMLGRDLSFDDYETDEEDEDGNTVYVNAGQYWCGDENASDYDIGEEFVSQIGFEGVANIENYFDYEAYGRDLGFEGFTITKDGCIEYT